MNQDQFAKAAGITQGHVSRIENGTAAASWELARKLAKLTGTEPILWMPGGNLAMRFAARDALTEKLWKRKF